MKTKKLLLAVFLVGMAAVISGCTIQIGGGKAKLPDGGVFKSTDGGVKWQQVINVPTTGGKVANIAKVDVRRLTFDPSDYETIYLATEKDGVVYTNDGGNNWRQFKQFVGAKIRDVEVDPKDKCNLYALNGNKLYKSTDCGRFWNDIYFHQNSEVFLTDILVDHNNSSVVYMTTSAGEVLKSVDGGRAWTTSQRVNNGIFLDLVMNNRDSKIVYAASQKHGLFKTTDAGATWVSLDEGLKEYSGSKEYKKLVLDEAATSSLILVSKFGMLRTRNAGNSWEEIELLPAAKKTTIYSLAVNPKNSQEIYYTTRTTLVKSVDGGQTWSSQELPTTRIANDLIINREKPQIIYFGTFQATE